jgi:hypothetical protein
LAATGALVGHSELEAVSTSQAARRRILISVHTEDSDSGRAKIFEREGAHDISSAAKRRWGVRQASPRTERVI